MKRKTLYENIMAGVGKSLKNCFMPLNESAFVMNAKSTSYIAQFIKFCLDDMDEYLSLCPDEIIDMFEGKTALQIYRELYKTNVLSVNYRYNDEDDDISYIDEINLEGKIYRDMDDLLSDINICQILMSLKCWSYQSCEVESDTLDAVDKLIGNLEKYVLDMYNVADLNSIPEYNNAAWD